MAELKKVKASMMNAVHDLPLLVARDEGFFRDEGLDVDVLVTPGSGQHNSDDRALKDDIFKRGLEATYDQGQCDQFRMCEWGIMKRAVETIQEKNLRPAKIVALGSAMLVASRLGLPLGRLPGDLHWRSRSGNTQVYFPFATSILLSILLSLILWLLRGFRK